MAWQELPVFYSSNISSARYDDDEKVLEVTFQNGGVYQYYDIPTHVVEEFNASASKGSFLVSAIKGLYRYSRV